MDADKVMQHPFEGVHNICLHLNPKYLILNMIFFTDVLYSSSLVFVHWSFTGWGWWSWTAFGCLRFGLFHYLLGCAWADGSLAVQLGNMVEHLN